MKNTVNKSLNNSLKQVLPGAVHYNFAFPWDKPGTHFISGEGHIITDADGNSLIDFFSKFGASFLGHCNPQYTKHLADKLEHSLTAVDHFGPDEQRITNKLVGCVPGAEQVRFSLSGTEAVQNALRAARAYTGKDKIIRFGGHYHGSADNILGGKSEPPAYVPEEMKGDQRGTAGRASHAFDATLLLPWNDTQALESVLAQHTDIAAIIMEPICINGGGLTPEPSFIKLIKSESRKRGFLVIFDEVITGFRLGFGSVQSRTGIRPDIWVFGKAIGGGSLPVACFMSSKKIMNQYEKKQTTHGGTFNGYPLGLHAVDITLTILGEPGLYEKTRQTAIRLQKLLLNAARANHIELVIQGDPLAMCLHAATKPIKGGSDWTNLMKGKEAVIRNCFAEHGIILAPPCRIYPTIALDNKVLQVVEEKAGAIFKQIATEYERHGYAG